MQAQSFQCGFIDSLHTNQSIWNTQSNKNSLNGQSHCFDVQNYVPYNDNHWPIKHVNMTFHVLQKADGSGNIPNNSAGINHLMEVVAEMNNLSENLDTLNPQISPPNFTTDSRIRYRLNSIEFHENDTAWNWYYDGLGGCFDSIPRVVGSYKDSSTVPPTTKPLLIVNGLVLYACDSDNDGMVDDTCCHGGGCVTGVNTMFKLLMDNLPFLTMDVNGNSIWDDTFNFGNGCGSKALDLYNDLILNGNLTTYQKQNTIHVLIGGNKIGHPFWFKYLNVSGFAPSLFDKRYVVVRDFVLNYNNSNVLASSDLLTHEIGHSLGLTHTTFTNCIYGTSSPASNSMMSGFDSLGRRAFGECEMAIMHHALHTGDTIGGLKDIWYKDYCARIDTETIFVTQQSAEVVWQHEKFAKGDIVIGPSATLVVKCDLYMPANSRIVVERGGKLIVDGGVITSSCVDAWQGIELHGKTSISHPAITTITSQFSTYPSNSVIIARNQQGVVYLKNGACIQNSHNAITTKKVYNYLQGSQYDDVADYGGGIIIAEDAHFFNNRRSIEWLSYQKSNIGLVNNCTFSYDDGVNTYGLNKPHITMWDVHGVTVNNSHLNSDLTHYNIALEGKGKGIYAEGAHFTCYNDTFTNLHIGVEASDGFYAPYCNPTFVDFAVNHSYFNGNAVGVFASGFEDAYVGDNNIKVAYH